MEKIQISMAAARVNANLTQQQVADKLKVSKQTIVNWEKGKTEPSASQAEEISKLYKFPRDNIFFNTNLTLSKKEALI